MRAGIRWRHLKVSDPFTISFRSAPPGLKLRTETRKEGGHENGRGRARATDETRAADLDHLEQTQDLDVPLTEYASAYGLDVNAEPDAHG